MKSGDEPAQSAAHTKPTIIPRNAGDEVECSKCHMYFGLKGTIEAHEKHHAVHADDELHKFQHPKDYTVDGKPADGKIDQFRKQKGLEPAVKNEIIEPSAAGAAISSTGAPGVSSGNVAKPPPSPITSLQATGAST